MSQLNYTREISAECLGRVEKQRVDETEELHHSFVLSQVLMSLQQEHVLLAIDACKQQSDTNTYSWPLMPANNSRIQTRTPGH